MLTVSTLMATGQRATYLFGQITLGNSWEIKRYHSVLKVTIK